MRQLVLLLFIPTFVACTKSVETSQPPPAVSTTTLQAADYYTETTQLVGRVVARRASDLGFELAGTIEEITVREGDRAAAGALLARLDSSRLQARRAELKARLAQAQASAKLAQSTFERTQAAFDDDALSEQELDEAKQGAAMRVAEAEAAEAALLAIEVDISETELRAPYAAYVVSRRADEGQIVNPGSVILGVIEATSLEAEIGMPEDLVGAIRPADRVSIRSGKESYAGTVRTIVPQREQGTRTLKAIIELEVEPPQRRPGDLAVMLLERRIDEAGFWVASSSVTEGVKSLWAVYAVEGEQPARLARRPVRVLHRTGDRVFIQGDITEGERIVASGLHRLVPGVEVRLAAN